jgi:hypothetical protein
MEAYFQTWDSDNYSKLNEELKKEIYNKYLMKCEVFNRDKFKCQNMLCKSSVADDNLTVHHIKWQKNGGKDTARNGVTLCKNCHHNYHRAKAAVQFADIDTLPPHIKGHTFKLEIPDRGINWKKVKKEMKILRKNLKSECGLHLTENQLQILMKWLEITIGYNSDNNSIENDDD